MKPEEKDALLLSLYQHEPEVLSFYFGDRKYQEAVIDEYKKKIEKVFNPSERTLMTKGVDTSLALSLLNSKN